MADDQQFCLRWNNFQSNFTSQFKALRLEEDFVDVTLACEGKRIKAHKLVLSACSPYFKELFKGNPCKHPIIFMQDVEYEHLMNLVEFMYAGQVNICQNKLPTFLHTAESLQIRGLSAQSQNKLPQNSERKANDLRPAPTLKGSPRSSGNSPEPGQEEERGETGHLPSFPSKRLCVTGDTNSHPRESTSYSEVPTTALIETKMEPMDYYSDGEVKPNTSHNSNADSHSVNRSGYSLQGALDVAAGMSPHISQLQETSQESLQDMVGEMCKPQSLDAAMAMAVPSDPLKPHSLDPRPCPECGRIYSNISNLRQHIRLIHYPECITCPLCFKPFKNKLYLRRHVMSYHEINLPSQNDLRYKYTGARGRESAVFTNKSEAPEGFYDTRKPLADSIASLFAAPLSKYDGKFNGKQTADTKAAHYSDIHRHSGAIRNLTESKVPNST
uniref:BTB domain-containing protein n=1 Tax=Graphocephala atropunctata TaxID=36148 RepID=A0A1B6LUS9_9HEMI